MSVPRVRPPMYRITGHYPICRPPSLFPEIEQQLAHSCSRSAAGRWTAMSVPAAVRMTLPWTAIADTNTCRSSGGTTGCRRPAATERITQSADHRLATVLAGDEQRPATTGSVGPHQVWPSHLEQLSVPRSGHQRLAGGHAQAVAACRCCADEPGRAPQVQDVAEGGAHRRPFPRLSRSCSASSCAARWSVGRVRCAYTRRVTAPPPLWPSRPAAVRRSTPELSIWVAL
jgi:hypothetical protein